jgi:hypothetical protein
LPVQLEAPSKVSLFVYDNDTFIVHNFRDEPVEVTAVLGKNTLRAADLLGKRSIAVKERRGNTAVNQPPVVVAKHVTFELPPHSFKAVKVKGSDGVIR